MSGQQARALLLLALGAPALACGRAERAATEELRRQVAALESERERLRQTLDNLMRHDPLLEGMPTQPVRVGVPTELARELIVKLLAGFVDQVTLELENLRVRKSGTIRKIVTLGHYRLDVRIHRVTGKLKTGTPEVRFGGNQVRLRLPVTIASGSASATIDFQWDGRNVGGAVCGDLQIRQPVTGGVKPARYTVSGRITFTATAKEILATPRFPRIRVNLKAEPSEASWAAVQQILDEKQGLCGYVLDRVDVLGLVRDVIERGFDVRLPTEKIKPMAVPVAIEPTIEVEGQSVELAIKLGQLAITEQMIWLGADVGLAP